MEMFRQLIGPDQGYQTMAQLSARAVILFVLGVVYIRVAGRRTFSQSSPLDIIVYLIVGSNLSRVMTGKANVFPVMAATLVLVILHRLLAYATLRRSLFSRLLKSEPVVLVRDGVADETAMARHGVSQDDLLEALRLEQAETIAEVHLATLERSGKMSVIARGK
jgi:uncharacterized membrane protein YcaP (DUF421 family)